MTLCSIVRITILLVLSALCTCCYGATSQGTKVMAAYYGYGYFNNVYRCPDVIPRTVIDVTVQLQTLWQNNLDNDNLPVTFTVGDYDWGVPKPLPRGNNWLSVFYSDADMADVAHDFSVYTLGLLNGTARAADPVPCNGPTGFFYAYWGIPKTFDNPPLGKGRLLEVSAIAYDNASNELSWCMTQQDFTRYGLSDPALDEPKYLIIRWTNCLQPYGQGGFAGPLIESTDCMIWPPGLAP